MSKVSESFSSFDRENLKGLSKSKVLVGFFSVLLLGGGAVVAASPDVSIGQNGIQINTGSLDVNGNDIEDAGTTIWDGAGSYVPTSVVSSNGLDSSDVGLGNVRNVDLSNTAGSYLTYDSNNDNFNVDTSFDSNADTECSGTDTYLSGAGTCETDDTGSGGDGYLPDDPANSAVDMNNEDINNIDDVTANDVNVDDLFTKDQSSIDVNEVLIQDSNDEFAKANDYDNTINLQYNDDIRIETDTNTGLSPEIQLHADDGIELDGDHDGTGAICTIDTNGNLDCDGSKNWIHDLGNGSEAVYSSQESPEVRAVYEGQTTIENGETTVSLPKHFEKTVSDTKPMLRVQATPHELATVAVTERSDSSLTIEASKDVTVDYRVTGIREGYENKQVVRPKDEE